MAKSLVIVPLSMVSTTVFSNVSQNYLSSALLSNLALCNKPLVHAKMEATEFVEVSFPY